MFLRNGSSILHPQSIFEMRTPVSGGRIPYYSENLTSNSTESVEVGLGLYWRKMKNGHRYVGLDGSMPGVVNSMVFDEKNNLGVVVLSNGDITAQTDRSQEISETLENIWMSLFECFTYE